MNKLRKPLLILLAIACVAASGWVQTRMNEERRALGLTRSEPLENAPPVLAFTTVALGGFRGLISNALWMRANELQQEGKFFEMAQLADWITKLEPGFAHVWVVQAWNMSYNISVKFKDDPPGDFTDRWRWVQRGIELLRDQGLRYNPNEPMIYEELSWHFFHKLGDNLDDGNMFYKTKWAEEMAAVLGDTNRPNFDALIQPDTDADRERARVLRERYKLDPAFMKQIDEQYGPLEWRLPEAHAIYWSARGLEVTEALGDRVDQKKLDRLRRGIYQGMQRAFRRGRLISYGEGRLFRFGPNLELIPSVNAVYEQMKEDNAGDLDYTIGTAHANFLSDAVYFLYSYNRLREAQEWFDYIAEIYPDHPMLSYKRPSCPRDLTLDEYCVERIREDLGETSQVRVAAILQGLVTRSFMELMFDNDDQAAGLMNLASAAFERYKEDTREDLRTEVPSMDALQQSVLNELLDPETGLVPEARARLRFKLEMEPEPEAPATTPTNAVPDVVEPAAE